MNDDLPLDELPNEIGDLDAHVAHSEPDPNSLTSVLAKAIREVDEIGGPDRARLSTVVGRKMYDAMMSKTSGRNAMDAWLSSPKTKSSATRMLALAVAREAERPDLVDRIAREINDDVCSDRPDDTKATVRRLPTRHQEQVRAQQRSSVPASRVKDFR